METATPAEDKGVIDLTGGDDDDDDDGEIVEVHIITSPITSHYITSSHHPFSRIHSHSSILSDSLLSTSYFVSLASIQLCFVQIYTYIHSL